MSLSALFKSLTLQYRYMQAFCTRHGHYTGLQLNIHTPALALLLADKCDE